MKKSNFTPPNRSKAKSTHVNKSQAERKYYTKAIKEIRVEPTLDESLDFVESDNLDSDFSVSETAKKRKVPLKMKLKEYIEKNWPIWVPTIIVGVITPWFFNSILDHRDRITKTESKVDYIDRMSLENKTDIKEINATINDQALEIKEVQIRMGIKSKK